MTNDRTPDVFALVADDDWSLDESSLVESGTFAPLSREGAMESQTRPAHGPTTREIRLMPVPSEPRPIPAPSISADMLERDAKLALRRGDTRLAMKLLDRVRKLR
jgi:hypothetical protein